MNYTTDYGANAKTQAQIDALSKATLADFRVGLTYKTASRIGQARASAGNPTTHAFSDRFVLKTVTVTELGFINQAIEFYNLVQYGKALDPQYVAATTTVPATTTA